MSNREAYIEAARERLLFGGALDSDEFIVNEVDDENPADGGDGRWVRVWLFVPDDAIEENESDD
jgi:hypothetical protein